MSIFRTPYSGDHVIGAAEKHQQNSAHDRKKLKMDYTIKYNDNSVPDGRKNQSIF